MGQHPAVIVEGVRPLSCNVKLRKRKAQYAACIRAAASRWGLSCGFSGRLYCKVFYFHLGRRDGDADNFTKPIVDALQGCVYRNDSQVALRVAAKIDLAQDTYTIEPGTGDLPQYEELQRLIAGPAAEKDVLYVEVGELQRFELELGTL